MKPADKDLRNKKEVDFKETIKFEFKVTGLSNVKKT